MASAHPALHQRNHRIASYKMLHHCHLQIVFPGEENEIKHAIPTLDHQEDKSKTWEDQDPSCLSSQQMQNNIAQETSPLLPSGSESCLGMSQSEQQREFSTEESRIKYAMPSLDRGLQKRKTSKEKGTSSIRRFFKTCDPISFRKPEHVEAIQLQDVQAASSVGFQATSSICSEPNQTELPMESILEQTGTNNGCSTLAHIEQQSESWRYKVDEIDPSVVMELPPEIQEEVQAWLRPHKRPNVVKKGSSIAHCFLPAKNKQLY